MQGLYGNFRLSRVALVKEEEREWEGRLRPVLKAYGIELWLKGKGY